ncbi:MAG: ABC transporter substrate-binding protein [Deltaproteobacteria bacterium]|nr:ABC transporter substrate-binding protein [Deltaproteobacteria bacterium]
MKQSILVSILVLVAFPGLSYGEEPIDVLKKCVAQGIRILENPRYSDLGQKDDQLQKLMTLLQQNLDFAGFSRLVLAVHWRKFSMEQREEFTRVFTEFISRFYMRKLQERYRGEKIKYIDQRFMTESKAEVNIEVTWRDVDIPAQVRMIRRKGAWKAYDAMSFGISFMRNYRAQFSSVLRTKSPDQVIAILKEKIERLYPN